MYRPIHLLKVTKQKYAGHLKITGSNSQQQTQREAQQLAVATVQTLPLRLSTILFKMYDSVEVNIQTFLNSALDVSEWSTSYFGRFTPKEETLVSSEQKDEWAPLLFTTVYRIDDTESMNNP
jgi:hypothetical protein